jgi:hypothetical protein
MCVMLPEPAFFCRRVRGHLVREVVTVRENSGARGMGLPRIVPLYVLLALLKENSLAARIAIKAQDCYLNPEPFPWNRAIRRAYCQHLLQIGGPS